MANRNFRPYIRRIDIIEKHINYVYTGIVMDIMIMSHDMRFPAMWYVRPATAQISLRISAFYSEPLLVA